MRVGQLDSARRVSTWRVHAFLCACHSSGRPCCRQEALGSRDLLHLQWRDRCAGWESVRCAYREKKTDSWMGELAGRPERPKGVLGDLLKLLAWWTGGDNIGPWGDYS